MTFPTWPRPSRRLPGPPGSLSHSEGTFSICRASRDFPLQLSSYIPFTKNNLDLRRKKVRWKNVVRERVSWDWGTGSGCSAPFLPTHTHASWGAFPSAVWAACTVEGAVLAQEAKTLRGGPPPLTIPFFPLSQGCRGLLGRFTLERTWLCPASHVPWHRALPLSGTAFPHTHKGPPGPTVLAPVSLLLICLKQNLAK